MAEYDKNKKKSSKSDQDIEKKSGFESSQQVSGSSKSEGNERADLSGKSNEEVRTGSESSMSGGSDVEKGSLSEEDEDSELKSREGPFGEGIPRRDKGDIGYGRHTGDSGAM